jgi:hypothetical protein
VPPFPPGLDRRYRVEYRNWGSHKHLDMDMSPEGFVAWRERALGFLAADRPDIRKLLLWAEAQPGMIGEAEESHGAAANHVKDEIGYVS